MPVANAGDAEPGERAAELGVTRSLTTFLTTSRDTCSTSPCPIPYGDLCITPVYLPEEAIFSVIPVKLAPYSDTGTGI